MPVRLVVDRQGSRPEGKSHDFYRRMLEGGVQVCVVRGARARAPFGPLDAGGATRWNLAGLGHVDHRKVLIVDGRVGWVGGAGIEDHFRDGRFHDLFLRTEGPVVAQLQLVFIASFRWLGGEIGARSSTRCCRSWTRTATRCRRASCTTRRGSTGRSPTRSGACSTRRGTRSTW